MNTPDGLEPVARLNGVSLRYRHATALDNVTLAIPAQSMVSLIGPDGVGKSSLLALIAGARVVQSGTVTVLGGDMSHTSHRRAVGPNIAYMPQGLGKNLYPTLSVQENLQFFGRLFGHSADERRRRIDDLTRATGLFPFLDRPAGKLSGGMKQKLGLCCALIHDPELLILDEPTTGVDPLARRQFWDLIDHIRDQHAAMSVIVATAYMDEASRFDWLVAMDEGKILATGAPHELMQRTGTQSPEAAFIALMSEEKRDGHAELVIPPLRIDPDAPPAIEARGLTRRFGDFVAVDHVNFEIRRGEIFGFLGSNGCGKTTTMRMLTGLLPATEGESRLFGHKVDPRDLDTRKRVGYMSQSFSLYPELTVRQNLVLHARLFHVPEESIDARVEEMISRFGLEDAHNILPGDLPMGMRQRLSLAVAVVHRPEMLILDEPTSGVDPIARDDFWRLLIDLSRRDGVTIFITTHFMNEGERCDRVSLMHAGKVLVSDPPDQIARQRGVDSLEEAFILYLEDAGGSDGAGQLPSIPAAASTVTPANDPPARRRRRLPGFSLRRALSYTSREALEVARDPIRETMALLGSVILLFIIGYGITMDVDDLTFAVLDRDQTGISNRYRMNLSGSRYFVEREPIRDYAEMDARMRAGALSLAIEIPSGFARDVQRGAPVQVGAWIDGAMPSRAETIQGYVQGIHQQWLTDIAAAQLGHTPPAAVSVETRFRYNPDLESLHAIVPAVIPLLLLLIPAMLTALSVVREKEMGSIINLYVTPVTRTEFLLGKQLPYVVLGMINYLLLVVLAILVFDVPISGSFATLTVASGLFLLFSTGFGLLCSTFTRTQIAALFVTILLTMIPAAQYSGLLIPVSSVEGAGGAFGRVYPVTHLLIISRGVFSKGLSFADLQGSFWPVIVSVPIVWALAVAFLRKQEK